MPKELWKITRFDGGLDTASDARDINPENLSTATGIDVGDPGKVKMSGGVSNTSQIGVDMRAVNHVVDIWPGYNTHYWWADHKWGNERYIHGMVSVDSGYMGSAPTGNADGSAVQMFSAWQIANVFTVGGNKTIATTNDNSGGEQTSRPTHNQYPGYDGNDTYVGQLTAPDDDAYTTNSNDWGTLAGGWATWNAHSGSITTSHGLYNTVIGYSLFANSSVTASGRLELRSDTHKAAAYEFPQAVIAFNTRIGKRYNLDVDIVATRKCYAGVGLSSFLAQNPSNGGAGSGGAPTNTEAKDGNQHYSTKDQRYRKCFRSEFPGEYKRFLPNDFVATDTVSYFVFAAPCGDAGCEHDSIAKIHQFKIYECDPTWSDANLNSTINTTANTDTQPSPGAARSSDMFSAIDSFAGEKIYNVSDGSCAYIESNTGKTITHSISFDVTQSTDSGIDRDDYWVHGDSRHGYTDTNHTGHFVKLTTSEQKGDWENLPFCPGQRIYLKDCDTGGGTTIADGLYNIVDAFWSGVGNNALFQFTIDVEYTSSNTSCVGTVKSGLAGGINNGWQTHDHYRIGGPESSAERSTYAIANDKDSGAQYIWWKEHKKKPWITSGGTTDIGSYYPTAPDYYTVNGNLRISDTQLKKDKYQKPQVWSFSDYSRFSGTTFDHYFPGYYWANSLAAPANMEYGSFTGSSWIKYRGIGESDTTDTWPKETYTIEAIRKYHGTYFDGDADELGTYLGLFQEDRHPGAHYPDGGLDTGKCLYEVEITGNIDDEVIFPGQTVVINISDASYNEFNDTYTVLCGGEDNSRFVIAGLSSLSSDEFTGQSLADGLEVPLEFVPRMDQAPSLYMSIQNNHNATAEGDGLWKDDVRYYSTWVYDGFQESLPVLMDNKVLTGGEWDAGHPHGNNFGTQKRFKIYIRPGHKFWHPLGSGYSTSHTSVLSERITGARVYYRKSNTSGLSGERKAEDEGPLYLIADCDFRDGRGVRKNKASDDWVPFVDWKIHNKWRKEDDSGITTRGSNNASGHCFKYKIDELWTEDPKLMLVESDTFIEHKGPPTDWTYEDLAKVNPEEESIIAQWKCSAVLKNRVFIGNVAWYSKPSGSVAYTVRNYVSDGMMVSTKGKPDVFPKSGLELLGSEYQDEITSLETYGDRILQFRKGSMHIFNIQNDVVMTESSHRFKGAGASYATCQTDFGVAWAGVNGVYLYDGEKVINLMDRKGLKVFSEKDWSDFYTEYTAIGYEPKTRKLIVNRSIQPLKDHIYHSLSSSQKSFLAPAHDGAAPNYRATMLNFHDTLNMIHPNGWQVLSGSPLWESNYHLYLGSGKGLLRNQTAAQSAVSIKLQVVPGKSYNAKLIMRGHNSDAKMSIGNANSHNPDCFVHMTAQDETYTTPAFKATEEYVYLVIQMDGSSSGDYWRCDDLEFYSENYANSGDCYIFDMVMSAWTFHPQLMLNDYARGRFLNDEDGNMLYIQDVSSGGDEWPLANLKDPVTQNTMILETKDIDFDCPGQRKKVYKVYLTYKCSAGNAPGIVYYTNGDTSTAKVMAAVTAFNASGSEWKQAIYKPNVSAEANNIDSIKFRIYDATSDVNASFELNDISISYRKKQIK